MTKVTYVMSGLKELENTLRQIPKAMGRRAGLNALRSGGEPIAKAARAMVPVDEGDLRESIDVTTRLSRSQTGDKGALAPVEMYVGPGPHPQGVLQEFGTYKEPAQPFLRPAWDAERIHTLDIIGTSLGIEIDKAAKRHAKKIAKGRAR